MFKTLFRLAPALALSLCVASAPAIAHHDEGGEAAGTASAAAAPADEEPEGGSAEGAALDGLPANEIGAAASKVSAPILKPSESLHTAPKVLNNSALTNDFKSAMKKAAPPIVAPASPLADSAIAEPAPADLSPFEPDVIQLEIAPDTNKAAADASAAPAAAEPAPAPSRPIGPILALVALGVAALGGGLAFRFVRGVKTP